MYIKKKMLRRGLICAENILTAPINGMLLSTCVCAAVELYVSQAKCLCNDTDSLGLIYQHWANLPMGSYL
ncbi:hypothetical protein XELAEV_18024041mg [Xenopus laevis]|uniref:Uncharacterized protein n=1 Tax=Xenopus laevis TaxID=8355 RepID=A0A974D7Q1_XENLA|nr:hypothetical protein XELAEV_18024041mg [Xenopus laevis]